MSATMDNLLKMVKAACDTTGESSGTTPLAADVEALPVEMEVRAPYPGEMVDNPCEGRFTIYEIVFLLGAILGVQGLTNQENLIVGKEYFRALYFLKQNSDSRGRVAFVKRSRNPLKFEDITNLTTTGRIAMPWAVDRWMLRVARGQLHSSGVSPVSRLSNSELPDQSLPIVSQVATRVSKILSVFEPPSTHSQAARRTRSSTNMSGKGKSKVEPPSADEMSEIACASIPRPPEHKREDEEWRFVLMVPQGLSLQGNHHAASQIGRALMTKVLGMPKE
ncbi:hypothetical protein TIFTF001_029229 [Ficus carica]|uniref:Uncharacterized protein n=1 Tax=Ficus carica TaxID=3494 RepID=A0AA88DRR7_FICCA|nr:hypothetical protein TIFTF001_029229 [Ficus carica]